MQQVNPQLLRAESAIYPRLIHRFRTGYPQRIPPVLHRESAGFPRIIHIGFSAISWWAIPKAISRLDRKENGRKTGGGQNLWKRG
jgi:hypothetical protein